jgi:hypothetical protein
LKSWDYIDGIPNVPVAIIGKDTTIREWGLVDSVATYCVIHEDLSDALDVEIFDETKIWGFGSKKAKRVKRGKMIIRFITDKEVVVAVPSEDDYPEKAHRLIIGRNFMEKFRILMDRISQRISVYDAVNSI